MTVAEERVAHQVGGALRRIRLDRRSRQVEVAKQAGVSKAMLCAYERGRHCPSLPTLIAILRALQCGADEFGGHLGPWGLT